VEVNSTAPQGGPGAADAASGLLFEQVRAERTGPASWATRISPARRSLDGTVQLAGHVVVNDDAADRPIQFFVRKLLRGLGKCCCLLGHRAAPPLGASNGNGPICPAAVTAITNFLDTVAIAGSRLPAAIDSEQFRPASRTGGRFRGSLSVR
jgi:hypothetical protein